MGDLAWLRQVDCKKIKDLSMILVGDLVYAKFLSHIYFLSDLLNNWNAFYLCYWQYMHNYKCSSRARTLALKHVAA